jgi:hypothetical protein
LVKEPLHGKSASFALVYEAAAGVQQLAVFDTGWAGSFALTASQAALQVGFDIRAEIELILSQGLHQTNTATG